ncbi:hypothetical protein FNF27_06800 [Cafeteria roenbergensis]|uniref:Uncharacterized protein n=1 Tax=Cafeteria roenbergensis TaxID=33653 RepID=A0A5A8DXG8_CAFRO|nr:hypothetical protein FNF27_06800 [Cafeteria roenbergensis]
MNGQPMAADATDPAAVPTLPNSARVRAKSDRTRPWLTAFAAGASASSAADTTAGFAGRFAAALAAARREFISSSPAPRKRRLPTAPQTRGGSRRAPRDYL